MDDSGGVVGRRNVFHLDRRTLAFIPAGSGYALELAEDTFDAAAGGTRLPLADDNTHLVALPFAFRFFGVEYGTLWVNSNGSVTFTRGDTDYSGSLGHFAAGPPAIAALFTDLDPSQSADGVRLLVEPSRVTVTWNSVPLAGPVAPGFSRLQTFQIRLYPTGRIELAYRGASPPAALVGIAAGGLQPVDLVHFSTPATFPRGVAETFAAADSVDVVFAAQRFYQTHDDAYDYLVFYNALGVAADTGVVAYTLPVRSRGEGYGDTPVDIGAELGSRKRLQAVLNMGPLSQYPLNPNGTVSSRVPIGDTPLTLLGHETGHLFLALVSVPDPSNPGSRPMLGRGQAHWSFPFNSEASLLEGERIADRGSEMIPRFMTTATVEGYSELDQYLMGFLAPEEVPPTFVVLNSGQPLTRAPQVGIGFNGNRLDVSAADVAQLYGRRTPDSTVTQRRFRFAFVLIVPAGAPPPAGAVEQVEEYRRAFEPFFAQAAGNRAFADTSLKRGVALSLAPAAGVLEGAYETASLELAEPAAAAVTFTLRGSGRFLLTAPLVTIAAGSWRATFPIFGGREGVEELSAEPSDAAYETAYARVQVNPAPRLRLALVSAEPLAVRAEDANLLAYAGVRVNGTPSAADGVVQVQWPATEPTISVSIDQVASAPVIYRGGVVDAFTYQPRLVAGGYVSIFGENLEGGWLRIDGAALEPLYVSAVQVNFLAPANSSPGTHTITIETPQGVAAARVQFAAGP